jgi:hypothetical protein
MEGAGVKVQFGEYARLREPLCAADSLITEGIELTDDYAGGGRPERSSARAGAA